MSFHLKIIFFLTFTQGLFQTLGVPFGILKIIQEAYIVIAFLIFFKFRRNRIKYGILVFIYILIALVSSVYNDNSIISAILYSRFHFYALLIFLLASTYDWKFHEIESQYKFMKKLFILQILYAIYEIFILQDIQEEIVGTITISGGELATIIPLVGLCFFFSEYLYKSKKIPLLLCAGLILIGFASAKRGIVFYFPITLLIIYFLYMQINKISKYKRLPQVILVSIAAIIVFFIGISNSQSLNYDGSANTNYAIEYASNYTTATSYDGKIIGRIGASLETLARTGQNGLKDWIGFGPEILMGKSGDFELYKIDYGIVGWSKEVLSLGWLGMLFYLLLYFKMFRYIYKNRIVFFKTIYSQYYLSFLSFFIVFVLMFFTYSVTFSVSGTLLFYFTLFTGILYSKIRANKIIQKTKLK